MRKSRPQSGLSPVALEVIGERFRAARVDETLLPIRKGRADRYSALMNPEGDHDHEAVRELLRSERSHPDHAARQRIEACLQQAHLHPDLARSPELSKLLFVFRELVIDFVPGETVDQALEPLRTLFSRRGGGRPSEAERNREWAVRLDQLKKKKPTLQAQERYEEIASEWEADGHAPVSWKGVRNAIAKAKKAAK